VFECFKKIQIDFFLSDPLISCRQLFFYSQTFCSTNIFSIRPLNLIILTPLSNAFLCWALVVYCCLLYASYFSLDYVNMRDHYVNMQYSQELWNIAHLWLPTCKFKYNLFMSICNLFMWACEINMSTCNLFMSTCILFQSACIVSY
jgi:hypothetical protein